MNHSEITTVLKELHNVTGFRVSLHGADYREIAAYPTEALPFCKAVNSFPEEHKRCMECDRSACERATEMRESYIYECHFGLTESVSPLYNFGELTGFLMMGQIAQSEKKASEAVRRAKAVLGVDEEFISSIPTVSGNLIHSYAKIMEICARYLTLSGALEETKPSFSARAKRYIHENLGGKILISDICREIGCSKSTLITSFMKEYGTTVNAYITDERVRMAKRLLLGTELSLAEIASEVGFSDQAYFSRVFTARVGESPWKYKKTNKNI